MAIAFDGRVVREYVPKSDRALPPDQQTVFLYRPLSNTDEFALADKHGSFGTMERKWWYGADMVKRALVGWRNFKMANGEEAPFTKDEFGIATNDTLNFVGPLLTELIFAIRGVEDISAGESSAS